MLDDTTHNTAEQTDSGASTPAMSDAEAMAFFQEVSEDFALDTEVQEVPLKELSVLASGGTGEICSGRDATLGRVVAMKSLKPDMQRNDELIARLIREAKAAAQLEHPNIVPVHSLGISPTKGVYFTMKRLRGDSLRHIINELAEGNPGYRHEYPPATLLNIFLKICQGISYAHSKGVIHRDLKPENILVGNYGEVTIVDWGLVKKMPSSREAPRRIHVDSAKNSTKFKKRAVGIYSGIELPTGNLTINGEISGTPRFMSPEQIFGNTDEIDARTDIYSLGIILYELLAFTNPFNALDGEEEILNAVSKGQFLLPHQTERRDEIAPEVEAICLKAMQVNKELRYQAVGEMIKDIVAYQNGRAVSAYKQPMHIAFLKVCQRNPIKTSIIISTICVILALNLLNYFWASWRANEIIRTVEKEVAQALNRLETMEKNTETISSMDEKAIVNRLNEIDSLLLHASQQLNEVPAEQQKLPQLIDLRERMLTERVRFSLKYGNVEDMRKLANLLKTYGEDATTGRRRYSGTLHKYVQILTEFANGKTILEITPATSDCTYSIYMLFDDTATGTIIRDAPVEPSAVTQTQGRLQLRAGAYEVVAERPGCQPVSYVIRMDYGETASLLLKVPRKRYPGMVYIPEEKVVSMRFGRGVQDVRRGKAFFISEYEVTNEEYLEFWKSLKDPDQKRLCKSRIILNRGEFKFIDAWDEDGKLLDMTKDGKPLLLPNAPVVGISQTAAEMYCKWKGKQFHHEGRLPTVAEWNRAAFGDDGRKYPWGNGFQPEYALIKGGKQPNEAGFALWAPVGYSPRDVSPHGVHDMAGSVREWTSTVMDEGSDTPQIRGASIIRGVRYLMRDYVSDTPGIPSDVGFRVVFEEND